MISSFRNFMQAGALVVMNTLAGCASQPTTIPPLDPPDPRDRTIPDTPEANLDACLPVDSSGVRLRAIIEGDYGSLRMSLPSTALTILSGSGGGQIQIRGDWEWASFPREWETRDPDDPDDPIGPLAILTQERLNRYRLHFEGILTYPDCIIEGTLRSAGLDDLTFPLYEPGPEAAADYANESIVTLEGPVGIRLPVSGTIVDICNGDCVTTSGSPSVTWVRMRLIPNAPSVSGDAGIPPSGDAGTGG